MHGWRESAAVSPRPLVPPQVTWSNHVRRRALVEAVRVEQPHPKQSEAVAVAVAVAWDMTSYVGRRSILAQWTAAAAPQL
jgi:hypothetical protein